MPNFKELNSFTRVPKKFRKMVRYSEKITFIYPNMISVRVVKSGNHHNFLKQYGNFLSSSANISGKNFEKLVAIKLADIICEDKRGLFETDPSKIYRLYKNRVKKIR